MNQQKLEDLFRAMIEDNQEAADELATYLHVRGIQAAAGDALARSELESLVYGLTRKWVAARMIREFPFLVDRHSVGSVLHPAWLRVLGPTPAPTDDLGSLCRRIGRMVGYAFLDIANDQRSWDQHHQNPIGCSTSDTSDFFVSQANDSGSVDPYRLAVWTAFHEGVASLPDDERDVFELAYYVELPRRQIADRLQITEYRVRVLTLQAQQRLGQAVLDLI